MRRSLNLALTAAGLAAMLIACPRDKALAPAIDAGGARVSPPPPAADQFECPKVRSHAISTPKGAPAELRVLGSAPGRKGRPVAILLATNDELAGGTAFPPALVDALIGRQLNVVEAVGVRSDEAGGHDARTVKRLALLGSCEADPDRVAFIASPKAGAIALELATSTTADDRPAALVLLSGGEYTESLVQVSSHRLELETLPILFLYSDRDAAWSTQFQTEPSSPLWLFRRQAGDAHGLGLLDPKEETLDDLAVFLEGFLQ